MVPPVLCSSFPIGRTVFYLSPVNRFKPLSCKIHGVDDSDEHYYRKELLKYWDKFYKFHQNKFFKDRHYLKKDWGKYFSDSDDAVSADGKVLLEGWLHSCTMVLVPFLILIRCLILAFH